MASQGGGSAEPTGRLRSMLLDAPLRWLGASIALLVILVSGLFGGFDRVHPKSKLGSFALNAVQDEGGWKVTVHSVRALDELKPLTHQADTGWRWIIVVATVEITADESTNLFDAAIEIRGIEGVPSQHADHVVLASDATEVHDLQPNVPARLGFFWEQRSTAPVPKNLQVGLFGFVRSLDPSTNLWGWQADQNVRAAAMLPVDTTAVPQ